LLQNFAAGKQRALNPVAEYLPFVLWEGASVRKFVKGTKIVARKLDKKSVPDIRSGAKQ